MCVLYFKHLGFFKLESFQTISELYRLSYVHCSNFLQALLKNRNVAFRLRPLLPPPVGSSFSCIEKVQPHHQNAMWFVSDVYRTLCSFRLAYLNCIIQPNPAGFSIVNGRDQTYQNIVLLVAFSFFFLLRLFSWQNSIY